MADAPSSITPLHTIVPGRARFRVAGLYRGPQLKQVLEHRLPDGRGILSVSASVLTGTILVRFHSDLHLSAVRARLEVLVVRFSPTAGDMTGVDEQHANQTGERIWHDLHASEVAGILESSTTRGISTASAKEKLERFGPNVLSADPPRSQFQKFVDQFRNLPAALLLASAGLSLATGGLGDAVAILAVVALNAAINFATERQAASRISALLVRPKLLATVCRDGELLEIPADELVPGDLMVLKRGIQIAADARIVRAHGLQIDESALTGESFPVTKTSGRLERRASAVGDRLNMAYSGTVVTGGGGSAMVVATGATTEIGRLHRLVLDGEPPDTPLQRQLAVLGRQLVLLASGVCGAVFVTGLLRGHSAVEMLKTAVSLAVASIPEGLPVIATTALASGMKAMLQHDILLRRLAAIETLGAIQIACLDKTGTLTMNHMSVTAVVAGGHRFDVVEGRVMNGDDRPFDSSPDLRRLLEVCVLCSETASDGENGTLAKSSTETALLDLAVASGADPRALAAQYPLRAQRDRTDSRMYMATWHESASGTLVAIKGSPLDVLPLCSARLENGETRPILEADRAEIAEINKRLAAEAMRVLAIAYVETASETTSFDGDGVWVGLVGMADPIRGGISEFIRELRRAGIAPIMITGDQPETASAIASELGMNDRLELFSRVNPSDKLRIVRQFQQSGYVVAMTGDGINDGPALRAADVGITLGQAGTEIAQDVSDVVLVKDDIAALAQAIREGRRVAENVEHAVHYIAATNFSEILLVFTSIALGLGQPLTTRQLLWINLLSDVFPELAFALEPARHGVLDRAPRGATGPLVDGGDRRRLLAESGVMTASALGAYVYGLGRYGSGPRSASIAFVSLAASQLFHAFTQRSSRAPASEVPRPAISVPQSVGAGLSILAVAQFLPGLGKWLGIMPLRAADLLVSAGAAAASLGFNEFLRRNWVTERAPATRPVVFPALSNP